MKRGPKMSGTRGGVAAVSERKGWSWLGNLEAVQGYSTPLSCHHCEVTWEGCAAAMCCPQCGAPKGYDRQDHDKCYCDKCRDHGVTRDDINPGEAL